MVEQHKKRTIDEILSYDKTKMFEPPQKKKKSFFKKILIALGYGKKG